MKLWARLPKDRVLEGSAWLIDNTGRVIAGPERCRGKADNAAAVLHGNPDRDPLHPYGDHPTGVWVIDRVVRITDPDEYKHYGAIFLALRALAGNALVAEQNGRTGIAVHGGPLMDDGKTLRPTNGCNRLPTAFMLAIAGPLEVELHAKRVVEYEATE